MCRYFHTFTWGVIQKIVFRTYASCCTTFSTPISVGFSSPDIRKSMFLETSRESYYTSQCINSDNHHLRYFKYVSLYTMQQHKPIRDLLYNAVRYWDGRWINKRMNEQEEGETISEWWIFRKWYVGTWNAAMWIRTGTGGGHLWMR